MTHYATQYHSPLGPITIICSCDSLTALRLPGQRPFGKEAQVLPAAEDHPILGQTARWLDRYFAGERPDCSGLPLAPEGSPFRQTVWKLLLQVPYGGTVTYGELARQTARLLGKERMSAQAVGGAVGANPIPIIIPCHRCLGVGMRLTGYAGGLQLKRALLDMEEITYTE